MKILKISENKALELHKTGSNELKEILEETFGKDFFKPKDITKIVYDLESLCEYLNINEDDLLIFKRPKNTFEKYINACAIIPKIVEVYNEGTILDWNDINQYKYLPYFRKVGSGWVGGGCGCWPSSAAGGPVAHHFKSNNLGLKALNNFKQIYIDYQTYKG